MSSSGAQAALIYIYLCQSLSPHSNLALFTPDPRNVSASLEKPTPKPHQKLTRAQASVPTRPCRPLSSCLRSCLFRLSAAFSLFCSPVLSVSLPSLVSAFASSFLLVSFFPFSLSPGTLSFSLAGCYSLCLTPCRLPAFFSLPVLKQGGSPAIRDTVWPLQKLEGGWGGPDEQKDPDSFYQGTQPSALPYPETNHQHLCPLVLFAFWPGLGPAHLTSSPLPALGASPRPTHPPHLPQSPSVPLDQHSLHSHCTTLSTSPLAWGRGRCLSAVIASLLESLYATWP